MSIKEMMSKIIVIEDTISNIYDNLYKLELSNDKDGCMYSHYINLLKDALKEEEIFFNSLNIKESKNLFVYIKNNRDKLEKRFAPNNFTSFIIDRIYRLFESSMINKNLNDVEDFNDFDIEKLNKIKEEKLVVNIVYEERDNIYLSFLDEYISGCDDIRVKNELVHRKYFSVFIGNKDFEKKVINRYFNTDKSLYIDSEITAELKDIDLNDFYSKKKEVAASLTIEYIEELIKKNYIFTNGNYLDKSWNINIFLKIRANCLLMDNETFKSFMDVFTKTEDIFTKINTMFDIDIIEVLKKDRERHKYLSLKRK